MIHTHKLDDEIYKFTPLQKDKTRNGLNAVKAVEITPGRPLRGKSGWSPYHLRVWGLETNKQTEETERRQWNANHPCRQTGPLSGANWRGARASLFCLDTSRQCCDRVQRVTRDQDLWPRFYSLRRLSAAVFWIGCRPPLPTEHLPKRRRTVTVDPAWG